MSRNLNDGLFENSPHPEEAALTEVGLARLRQLKVSKSATADFDARPSRRMAARAAVPTAILRDAPLRSGAPQDEVGGMGNNVNAGTRSK
jgi:hypothetical protein